MDTPEMTAQELHNVMTAIAERRGLQPAHVQAYVIGAGSCSHREPLWRACRECGREPLSGEAKDEAYEYVVTLHEELPAAEKREFWRLCREVQPDL